VGYPQRRAAARLAKRRRVDLTTHSRARSNTALFRTGDGDEADLPTLEDAACAATRLSCKKRHARRSRRAAQSPGARAPASRAVAAGGKRYGLDSARRLRQKTQFERLLREGRRTRMSGYTFYLERRDSGAARLGLLVTRQHAARATDRNRIKRCVREAFRLEQERLGPMDVLVRPPYGIKASAQMIERLRAIFVALSAA
jgi:ribonuclease P protein component